MRPPIRPLFPQPHPTASHLTIKLSSQHHLDFDDLYEYYDPGADLRPDPPQNLGTPVSQRRPPSTSTLSVKSLRRTPRLEERRSSRRRPEVSRVVRFEDSTQEEQAPTNSRPLPWAADILTYEDILTPENFRRLVSQESLVPSPSSRLSRLSQEALHFALEALTTGEDTYRSSLGGNPDIFRMSDFRLGDPIGVSNGARLQAGGSRAAAGGPVPAGGVRTPTEVMRARRERETRRRAQEEERLRLELEEQRRQQEEAQTLIEETPVRRGSSRRTGGDTIDNGRQSSGGQLTSRRQGDAPPAAVSRTRASTLDRSQPRPVVQQPRTTPRYGQQPIDEPVAGPSRTNQPDPNAPLGLDPSSNQQPPAIPQNVRQPQPSTQAQQPQPQVAPQPQGGRTSFPNSLERWEGLSSRWEGVTSSWIRRLEENSSELNREPLNQQMSRQVLDLSAAGAKLFLAIFELQRLRATTERRFQRWLFETRSELERYQSQQAEWERLLRVEREERARVVSTTGSAEAEKLKAEELVKEMRRELQISKEEARRAWEELGRREQEERDRTVSLRNGEPTLVGGVQVVPMTQGVPSRQTTLTQPRPQTRDGPYPGGPSASAMVGQSQGTASVSHTTLASAEEEERRFTVGQPAPAASPTDTDPFTEIAAREAMQAAAGRYPPAAPVEQYQVTQPPTSSAAIAALRAGQGQPYPPTVTNGELRGGYSVTQPVGRDGSGERFYQQPPTSAALQTSSGAGTLGPGLTTAARPSTRNTDLSSLGEPSYIPSTASGISDTDENDYEVDSTGNFRRDAEGRRILYQDPSQQPVRQPFSGGPDEESDEDDDYDLEQELAQERERARRYPIQAGRQQQQAQIQPPAQRPQYAVSATMPGPAAGVLPPPQLQISRPSGPSSYTAPAPAPQDPSLASGSTVDYEGQGYGQDTWENASRHRHQTRLSNIIEDDDERSRRTSPNPSRTSWISGGAGPSEQGSAGVGVPRPRQEQGQQLQPQQLPVQQQQQPQAGPSGEGRGAGGRGEPSREMRERYGPGLSGRQ